VAAETEDVGVTEEDLIFDFSAALLKYRYDDAVNQLLFVRGTGGSAAHIQFYTKADNIWTIDMECDGYIGKNGLTADHCEGDMATPVGEFHVLTAFGIKDKPDTALDYVDVTDDIWCSGEEEYYNQIIDASVVDIELTGNSEHMIDYSPQYNYGLFPDCNKECVYGKGSAIFVHCIGPKAYTAGCVAMPEADMLYVLEHSDMNLVVCIGM